MSKPPEEGRIWEWRAFGTLPDPLRARIDSLPVRHGLNRISDMDVYLVSQTSDQNIKLRRLGTRWVLKLKPLLERISSGIELYQESLSMVYEFPISLGPLVAAARLLNTNLPEQDETKQVTDCEQLLKLFRAASPPLQAVEVPKIRSQFLIDGGWIELADAKFPRRQNQTISIHSPNVGVVEGSLADFDPAGGLEIMNYVEACRRWG